VADARSPCSLAAGTVGGASGAAEGPSFRQAPLHEQWVAVLSGFAVKPAYMLLALGLVARLWRTARPELKALRWGLLCFLAGEAACAVNYLAFNDTSYLWEYLHSLGMAACFGFVTWAALEGTDRWLIRYTDAAEKCAALPLCRACIKYAPAAPCGLRRTFYVLIPAAMVLALVPLTAPLGTPSYNTRILGTFYNYSHAVAYQVFEIRYLPAVAIVLLGVSVGVLLLGRREPVLWSKVLFAAGMGALGFSLLRLVLLAPYRDNQVWFVFWEEATEMMFVAGAAAVLWIFRRGLFAGQRPSSRSGPAAAPECLPGTEAAP
jgi:hypothetical protein